DQRAHLRERGRAEGAGRSEAGRGSEGGMKRVPLRGRHAGLFALVDDEDYDLGSRHRWIGHEATAGGYATASIGGQRVYMHRLINRTPEGMHTDHIDRDTLRNTRGNLRTVTVQQNIANRGPQLARAGVTSTFKGVAAYGSRWTAVIRDQ